MLCSYFESRFVYESILLQDTVFLIWLQLLKVKFIGFSKASVCDCEQCTAILSASLLLKSLDLVSFI